MGGLFSKRSEDENIPELLALSNGTLNEETVYRIMMKSSCKGQADNIKELMCMYKRFTELDLNKRGLLTHSQFLSLSELNFSPFYKRLAFAIPFKDDEYVHNAAKARSTGIIDYPSVPLPANPPKTQEQLFRTRTAKSVSQIAPEPNAAEIPVYRDTDMLPYIDFEQFCVYLTAFCPRCPIDIKVQFLFRIFDFDNDGQISKQDLFNALQMLIGHIMSNPEVEEVVKHVFEEVDGAEKGHIDRDDFAKVMWLTDFDIKTSIDFTLTAS